MAAAIRAMARADTIIVKKDIYLIFIVWCIYCAIYVLTKTFSILSLKTMLLSLHFFPYFFLTTRNNLSHTHNQIEMEHETKATKTNFYFITFLFG
jgi:Ca2+/Na+ antiporter